MLDQQIKMTTSPYIALYDLLVKKDNLLCQINEQIDFTFIYEELIKNYSEDQGRPAQDPVMVFKYLMLKSIFKLSDVDVVARSEVDMSFKYFLGIAPEDSVIDPSLLTKFRKLRLKNIELLDLLLGTTAKMALEKGIIDSETIIIDSTHTKARYNQKSNREVLLEHAKKLRKEIYAVDEDLKETMPKKINSGILEEVIEYCDELISFTTGTPKLQMFPRVTEKSNYLKEIVEDNLEALQESYDEDARLGHKSYDTSFFGYKTHLAVTPERIIVAATVTSGEKHDGKELKELVKKTKNTGMKLKTVIGDGAYAEKENLELAKEEEFELIAKLSKAVTHGNKRNSGNFLFNKDAGMYVCPTGHMSIKKVSKRPKKNAKDGKGDVETYFFDVERCKVCPSKEGCYREGSKTKSFSVSIMSNTHEEHAVFQETEYFKEKAKNRYIVEAKNSELKHRHGYDVASSSGLIGMRMQGAVTTFVVNLKRIMKLMDE
ncbi:MAG: IS1182 family transposase [Clostridiaceae bacterium]|nr:IS1182 family transposase [Clostridiaceae bacterium]